MVRNSANGASLPSEITRQITSFRKKVVDIIVGNWEKGIYNTENFSETTRLDQPEPSLQSEQAELRAIDEMFVKKLNKNQT